MKVLGYLYLPDAEKAALDAAVDQMNEAARAAGDVLDRVYIDTYRDQAGLRALMEVAHTRYYSRMFVAERSSLSLGQWRALRATLARLDIDLQVMAVAATTGANAALAV